MTSMRPSAPGVKPIAVLLADDHAVVREGLRKLLETESDIQVVGEAANGREAVRSTKELLPAVVVMDIAMPVLDGVQATRLLKASQVTQDIKVIAYTAKTNVEDAPAATRLFEEVLRKPASPEAIISSVQRFAVRGKPGVPSPGTSIDMR